MPCQQCDRLRSDLKFRERGYEQAVKCIAAVEETEDAALFQKLNARLSEARLEHTLAKLELENHERVHLST